MNDKKVTVRVILILLFLSSNIILFWPMGGDRFSTILMLPMLLAGFSTDSGDTDYVLPIILIGYGIIILWFWVLYQSIRLLYKTIKQNVK